MVDRFGRVIETLRGLGLTPLPYIHGDTLTSMAIGVASYLNAVACVHVEAGIRTLTPRAEVLEGWLADHRAGRFDWPAYAAAHRDPATFERGSREPFPEQFNTRVSDAGSGFHAAPVELDRGFLLDEGFPADTVEVTGNTVVDATRAADADAGAVTIFETYPRLRGGRFVRICIHRRENTEDEARFRVLFDALETLVRAGREVLFIRLSAPTRRWSASGSAPGWPRWRRSSPRRSSPHRCGRTTGTWLPRCASAPWSRPTRDRCRRR